MNHKTFLYTCWLISCCSVCFSQLTRPDSVTNAETILKIEKNLMDALAIGDTLVWSRNLHDSFLIVTEDGSRNTKHELIAGMRPLPKGYSGQIQITEPRLTFLDSVAVLNYVADEEEFVYEQKLHTSYAVMSVYHQRGMIWKLFLSQIFEIPKHPPSITISKTVLKNYVGVYTLTAGVTYTVSMDHDTLYGQRTGRDREQLLPETENIFFRVRDTRGRKIFMKDEQGEMQLIDRRNGNDIIWKRSE